jgi:predicted XRE-type DNA-binding protein
MMKRTKKVMSVWDAIADTAEEAASLKLRADLMEQIAALVEKKGWTQAQAAKQCGVSQPRMNDLLRGKISKFSLDALVDVATALGCRVRMELKAA